MQSCNRFRGFECICIDGTTHNETNVLRCLTQNYTAYVRARRLLGAHVEIPQVLSRPLPWEKVTETYPLFHYWQPPSAVPQATVEMQKCVDMLCAREFLTFLRRHGESICSDIEQAKTRTDEVWSHITKSIF